MNGSGLPEVGCPLRKYYLFVESQEVGRRFQTLLQRGNGGLRKEVACWGTGGQQGAEMGNPGSRGDCHPPPRTPNSCQTHSARSPMFSHIHDSSEEVPFLGTLRRCCLLRLWLEWGERRGGQGKGRVGERGRLSFSHRRCLGCLGQGTVETKGLYRGFRPPSPCHWAAPLRTAQARVRSPHLIPPGQGRSPLDPQKKVSLPQTPK